MRSLIAAVCATAVLAVLPVAPSFAEEEGNWKRGRIYYRSACTACHAEETGESISPASMTIAEWEDWTASDRGVEHMGKYVSQAYRAEIAPNNKVAAKFAPISDEDMWADVRAFVIHGAKDSATPATCN